MYTVDYSNIVVEHD